MCGARVRPEDEVCRECGEPLRDSLMESDASRDITAVEDSPIPADAPTPASPAETNPDIHYDPVPPKRGPWLAIGLGALALLGVGAFAMSGGDETAEDPAPAPSEPEVVAAAPTPAAAPACESLQALEGHWTFTTEVTASRVVQSSGLNGFYALDVSLDGCTPTAALTKTGYTGRTYTDVRIQRGSTTLEMDGEMATGTFSLESSLGAQGTTEFSFRADGDALSGTYRQRGDRWNDAGLSGFLVGARGDAAPERFSVPEQPCAVRCSLACGSAMRDELSSDPLAACADRCEADPSAPARCGDAQELPAEYSLALQGPGTLSKLCKQIGGCAKKIGNAHPKPPTLGADRLPSGWSEVTMVRAKKEGGVRLALHGTAGWWLSEPVFDLPTGTRLGKLRLYARRLSEGTARKYVLGLARPGASDSASEAYIACRLDAEPSCIRVHRKRGSLVNALPEGALAIETAAANAVGVFHW